jgi:hypothetical protein
MGPLEKYDLLDEFLNSGQLGRHLWLLLTSSIAMITEKADYTQQTEV